MTYIARISKITAANDSINERLGSTLYRPLRKILPIRDVSGALIRTRKREDVSEEPIADTTKNSNFPLQWRKKPPDGSPPDLLISPRVDPQYQRLVHSQILHCLTNYEEHQLDLRVVVLQNCRLIC